jgi:hypothetical protein
VGRRFLETSLRFSHIPRDLGALYVAEFDGGAIKIGRSCRVRERLVGLHNKNGFGIRQFAIYPGFERLERACLRQVANVSKILPGRSDYFVGVSFDAVSAIVNRLTLDELAEEFAAVKEGA